MKLEELARLAGVSKTTASIILNGHAEKYRISKATCDKVLKLARKHHYIANAQAVGLRNNTSKLMALILPDLEQHGFAELSKHLERFARNAGFQLLISSSDDNPDTEINLVRTLVGRKVEAIFSVATLSNYSIYEYAEEQGIPVILLDHCQNETELDYVTSDDKVSAKALTKILLNHCQGDLVYFGGSETRSNSRYRLEGFKEAIDQADYSSGVAHIYHRDYSVEAGYALMEEYYNEHGDLPRHLFTASLTMMEGALQFVRKHIDQVSGEWQWATFGDSYVLDLLPFSIHSARQKYKEMAHKAMNIIEMKLNKEFHDGQVILEREILERGILDRESVARSL